MDLRSSASAALLSLLFLGPLHSQTVTPPSNSETNWYATVQVQVRDSSGHPVTGLEPANFILNENGTTDPIVSVESFQQLTSAPAPPPPQNLNPQPATSPALAQATHPASETARPTT